MRLFGVFLIWFYAHAGAEAFTSSAKSLFDHHLAGAMVILLGVMAFVECRKAADVRPVRYLWPLPLLVVACYLFLFSDSAEPWGLWFFHGDWAHMELEHKFMEAAAILIGLIELSVRTGWLKGRGWRHIVTSLIFIAGGLLVFHHGNHEHMVHIQHNRMAAGAIALAAAKFASDMQSKPGSLARFGVPLLFIAICIQLALYVE
jgi:hypothetical protein